MATIQQFNNDEKKDQQDQSTQQLSTGPAVTPSSGGAQGGSVGPGSRYQAPERKGSGRFTNLNKYLQANTGAGERLAGGIGQMAKRKTGQFEKQAGQQTNEIAKNIQSEKDRLAQSQKLNEQIREGQASQVAGQNLEDYTKLRTGQSGIGDIQQAGQQYQNMAETGLGNLQGLANQAKTEKGRFGLLRDTYGSPGQRYGLGQRRLDQLFLQSEGGGQLGQLQQGLGDTISGARDRYGNFVNQFGKDVEGLQTGVSDAQKEAMETLGAFGPGGTGAFGNIYDQLQQNRQQKLQGISDIAEKARQQLGQDQSTDLTLSQDVADALGLTQGMNIFDLDLSDWGKRLSPGETEDTLTMADVISNPQQTELSALQQLSGIDPTEQYLGEKEGSMLGFDDPTSGKMLTGQDFSKSLTDAAQGRGTGFEDTFFDKSVYEASKPYYEDYAKRYGLNMDSPYMTAMMEDDKAKSLKQLVEGVVGNTGSTLGNLSTSGYGGDVAEDITSKEQLQNILDRSTGLYGSTNQARHKEEADRFQTIINELDRLTGRKLNITPEEDIESGGYFNIL